MITKTCDECGRVFDLTDENDAAEFYEGHDCEAPKQTLEDLLENAPGWVEGVADLYRWATNYDYQTGTPYWAFCDLIGYSDEEFGQKMNPASFTLDYSSADVFSAALNDWSERPGDVQEFISQLHAAE